MSEKHYQQARDLSSRNIARSGVALPIDTIASALEAVERETALLAITVGEKAAHLPALDGDDQWCQASVDAACEIRNQYSAAIRAEFGIADKEKRP